MIGLVGDWMGMRGGEGDERGGEKKCSGSREEEAGIDCRERSSCLTCGWHGDVERKGSLGEGCMLGMGEARGGCSERRGRGEER